MNKSKFKKLKQVLIGIYTATFMINKFKVLLLDDMILIVALKTCVIHQHSNQQKILFSVQKTTVKKFLECLTIQKTIFSWTSDFKENSLLSFSIKISWTILRLMYSASCMILEYYLIALTKKLKIETIFKFECEKI